MATFGENFKDGNYLCACCHEPLLPGQRAADHEVYKCGELNYIELAHQECAEADADYDWRWDGDDMLPNRSTYEQFWREEHARLNAEEQREWENERAREIQARKQRNRIPPNRPFMVLKESFFGA